MILPNYETVDGRLITKHDVSRHHIVWQRDWYRKPVERKFREMGGAVLLLSNAAHRELHANVEPPHKINPNLMQDIYLNARRREYEDAYDLFNQIADYVANVAVSYQSDENVHDANLLYQNLVKQAPYIELGKLTLVRQAA